MKGNRLDMEYSKTGEDNTQFEVEISFNDTREYEESHILTPSSSGIQPI